MAIIWRPQMSVGNTMIDQEHKYLFCLVNTVELALKNEDVADLLELALEQLLLYTEEHFDREERLQLKINYPAYADHKFEHQQILEKLEALRSQLLSALVPNTEANGNQGTEQPGSEDATVDVSESGSDSDSGEATAADEAQEPAERRILSESREARELVELMRHWILDHVLQTDMNMKAYVQEYPAEFS